jgi:hypothetical protein
VGSDDHLLGAAAIDPELRPGPGPHFGIAGIVRRGCLNRIHVELESRIRGSVAYDDYVIFVPSGFLLSAFYVQLA